MKTTGKIPSLAIILLLSVIADLTGVTTGSVDGFVKDSATGQFLGDVKIILVSARTTSISFELRTDKKGHFYKSGMVPGNYKMTLEKEGYIPQGGSIRIVLDRTIRLEFNLEAAQSSGYEGPAPSKIAARGLELISAGRYEEAIVKFTEYIELVPLNPVPYFYRGLANERSEKTEEALQNYGEAISIKADFILPYTRSGILWAKKGDFEKAAGFYKKAIDLNDLDSTTHYNYGVCLTNLGKTGEAKAVYEKLLTLDPEYSAAYYQLGIICINAGEVTRAKELLETFLVKDPENKNAFIAREILKSLNWEL